MLAKGAEDSMVPCSGSSSTGVFTDIDDRDQIIAGYDRWLSEVREQIEPDRLVEWRPGDGWDRSAMPWACLFRIGPSPREQQSVVCRRKDESSQRDEARVASLPTAVNSSRD